MKIFFNKDFLLGTAISAYQVEGGNYNTDWYEFEKEGKVKNKQLCGLSTNHYQLYEKDFILAKKLGFNAQRLSIEWARIQPEKDFFNHKELSHYKKVLTSLKEKNMKVFLTLHHFTNPLWFHKMGGWENSNAHKFFFSYVKKVYNEYKDLVDFWQIFNEPNIFLYHGYLKGIWPPEKRSYFSFFKAFKQLVLSHKLAFLYIKSLNKKTNIGISLSTIYFESFKKNYLTEIIIKIYNFWRNHLFAFFTKNYFDFIGIQYYFREKIIPILLPPFIKIYPYKNHPLSDCGWEIYPKGLFHILKDFSKYKKPIYITENGVADAKDKLREKFIIDHLAQIKKSIKNNIDVRGYFYWSLLDNFEWKEGFDMRFGLIEVDFKTFKRKIRKSATIFKKIKCNL